MKAILSFSLFLCLSSLCIGQKINPKYDSTLAKAFGGDDNGMKKYILVILKTGSNTNVNKTTKDSLFAGHFNNMSRLVELKKLIVAGPIAKNEKTYRGIFILDAASDEEAKQILETDPAVKAKVLEAELYQWYGSAALPAYLEAADKISKFRY